MMLGKDVAMTEEGESIEDRDAANKFKPEALICWRKIENTNYNNNHKRENFHAISL